MPWFLQRYEAGVHLPGVQSCLAPNRVAHIVSGHQRARMPHFCMRRVSSGV